MPLDPQANADARAAVRAQAAKPPALNPDFPFERTPFDPSFFAVDQDPPKAPAATGSTPTANAAP
jgi:hypothetical protein